MLTLILNMSHQGKQSDDVIIKKITVSGLGYGERISHIDIESQSSSSFFSPNKVLSQNSDANLKISKSAGEDWEYQECKNKR